jgi:hypothetical protein
MRRITDTVYRNRQARNRPIVHRPKPPSRGIYGYRIRQRRRGRLAAVACMANPSSATNRALPYEIHALPPRLTTRTEAFDRPSKPARESPAGSRIYSTSTAPYPLSIEGKSNHTKGRFPGPQCRAPRPARHANRCICRVCPGGRRDGATNERIARAILSGGDLLRPYPCKQTH